MPVTDQQARAIAFLACASRPDGAPKWDEAGIYANVLKVRDRNLGSVVIATIQAAEDRNAQSPGVLPSAGPHWRNPESTPRAPLNTWESDKVCTTCSRVEAKCAANRAAGDDHPFVSRAANAAATARPPEAVALIVADLRQQAARDRPPLRPTSPRRRTHPHRGQDRHPIRQTRTRPHRTPDPQATRPDQPPSTPGRQMSTRQAIRRTHRRGTAPNWMGETGRGKRSLTAITMALKDRDMEAVRLPAAPPARSRIPARPA